MFFAISKPFRLGSPDARVRDRSKHSRGGLSAARDLLSDPTARARKPTSTITGRYQGKTTTRRLGKTARNTDSRGRPGIHSEMGLSDPFSSPSCDETIRPWFQGWLQLTLSGSFGRDCTQKGVPPSKVQKKR